MSRFRKFHGFNLPQYLFAPLFSRLKCELITSRTQLAAIAADNRTLFSPIFKDGEDTGETQLIAVMSSKLNGHAINTLPRDYRRESGGINVAGLPPDETTMLRFEDRFASAHLLGGQGFAACRAHIFDALAREPSLVWVDEFAGRLFVNVGLRKDAPLLFVSAFGNIVHPSELEGKQVPHLFTQEFSWRDRFLDGSSADVHFFPEGADGWHEMHKGNPFSGGGKKLKFGGQIHATRKDPLESADHESAGTHTLPDGRVVGSKHTSNSGGSKTETFQRAKRDVEGSIVVDTTRVEDGNGFGWKLSTEQELVPMHFVDDIGLTKLVRREEAARLAPGQYLGKNPGEWVLITRDGELVWWYLRGDDFSAEDTPYRTMTRAGHLNVFFNVRPGPAGQEMIHPWDLCCANSRANFPKFDSPNTGRGNVAVLVSRFGIKVGKGSPLSVFSVLSPAAQLAWLIAAPSLAKSPSFTVSAGDIPSEGHGTLERFNPGHRRDQIDKMIRREQMLGGSIIRTLIPNTYAGNVCVGYNLPRIAGQLTCSHLDRLFDGEGLSQHPGGGLFGRYLEGEPSAAGVPLPHGLWYTQPWTQPEFGGEDQARAWCEQVRREYFVPLMDLFVFKDRARINPIALDIATAACDGATEEQFASLLAG